MWVEVKQTRGWFSVYHTSVRIWLLDRRLCRYCMSPSFYSTQRNPAVIRPFCSSTAGDFVSLAHKHITRSAVAASCYYQWRSPKSCWGQTIVLFSLVSCGAAHNSFTSLPPALPPLDMRGDMGLWNCKSPHIRLGDGSETALCKILLWRAADGRISYLREYHSVTNLLLCLLYPGKWRRVTERNQGNGGETKGCCKLVSTWAWDASFALIQTVTHDFVTTSTWVSFHQCAADVFPSVIWYIMGTLQTCPFWRGTCRDVNYCFTSAPF